MSLAIASSFSTGVSRLLRYVYPKGAWPTRSPISRFRSIISRVRSGIDFASQSAIILSASKTIFPLFVFESKPSATETKRILCFSNKLSNCL